MDIFTHLSHDQLALLGCFGAIVISATIMSLSFYVGPTSKTQRRAAQVLPHVERMKRSSEDERRKAA